MVPVKLRYSPAVVICTLDAWNSLTEEGRQGLTTAAADVTRRFTAATRIDNEKALAALEKYGIEKVDLSSETVTMIKQEAVKIWGEQADKLYPKALLDQVVALLDDFRSQPQ